MNQIISYLKIKNRKLKRIFVIQLIISVFFIFILSFKYLYKVYESKKNNEFISSNYKIVKLYSNNNEIYLGNIIIDKINLNSPIFLKCSEENLKNGICKFNNTNINENGNIILLGHNYNDDRFFGNLNLLKKNDIVKLEVNRNNLSI